jgi:hypothetical protein
MSSNEEITLPTERTLFLEKLAKEKQSLMGIIKEKLISRKLLALALCTWLFWLGTLSEHSFMMVVMTYIGGQSIIDMMQQWKSTLPK